MTENTPQEKHNCPTKDLNPFHDVTLDIDPASVICGYNSGFGGACFGDSGSPLFTLDENQQPTCVYGVVSFGSLICKGTRSFFTRVPFYAEWIDETIKENY